MVGCALPAMLQKPEWLEALLSEKFFTACELHRAAKKNERNIFCGDCNLGVCQHCVPDHGSHWLLQIRRYVYHDVIRLHDIQKLVDCAHVQAYVINSAKVVFLNQRPQPRPRPSRGVGNVCDTCERSLQEGFRFCSVACKVDASVKRGEGLQAMVPSCASPPAAAAAAITPSASVKRGEDLQAMVPLCARPPAAAAAITPSASTTTSSPAANLKEEEEEQLSPNSVFLEPASSSHSPTSSGSIASDVSITCPSSSTIPYLSKAYLAKSPPSLPFKSSKLAKLTTSHSSKSSNLARLTTTHSSTKSSNLAKLSTTHSSKSSNLAKLPTAHFATSTKLAKLPTIHIAKSSKLAKLSPTHHPSKSSHLLKSSTTLLPKSSTHFIKSSYLHKPTTPYFPNPSSKVDLLTTHLPKSPNLHTTHLPIPEAFQSLKRRKGTPYRSPLS